MDLIKEISKNINLYEVKANIRKAQNVALNLSEMETKVREATNNEPWGAKTSLMAQIAAGTYNYREREEILSFIFRRFTEKAANEWRQIYKSLQLVEYLIKNGLERIIDDIRANISLIQMLKSFHYIDSKGRDQGINVRNRSKNLIALLNDDALIRLERKKARANAKKFGGVSSSAFGGASSISAGDGFGGDDDFNNRVYGDGGVFGARYDDPASAYNNGATGGDNNFEEYDVEPTAMSGSRASKPTTSSSRVNAGLSSTGLSSLPSKSKSQLQAPAQDLLGDLVDFGGSETAAPSTAQVNNGAEEEDDDFDDFQSAPSLSANATGGLTSNLANLYVSQPTSMPQYGQTQYGQTQYGQTQYGQTQYGQTPQAQPNYNFNSSSASAASVGPAKASTDAFSSLFSSAKTKTSTAPKAKPAASSQHNDFLTDDFTTAGTGSNYSSTKPQEASSSNTGEVDLLSF
ncbi:ENTH-domain-containing protein [Metschnikowia bicuspidata var. bicuspidata NRRL YB-4993]|uniref:ENTH-domain-containing protein n=1 Tax=Metschnikowia bicuspidata var. bicuspidata NRRL YB-4993 TaxID=869754 RepID=A0A1A0HF35_9ASCO|nr:ENTH-domain-containing protein [Metschnikowia bicuspidata var. bicuspidata NRRL YB-4993]OBA22507.1 ENTH-domain-containing protein [Metschnikowia bicuspidata var. bicuspidata NRRL YB-4993]